MDIFFTSSFSKLGLVSSFIRFLSILFLHNISPAGITRLHISFQFPIHLTLNRFRSRLLSLVSNGIYFSNIAAPRHAFIQLGFKLLSSSELAGDRDEQSTAHWRGSVNTEFLILHRFSSHPKWLPGDNVHSWSGLPCESWHHYWQLQASRLPSDTVCDHIQPG